MLRRKYVGPIIPPPAGDFDVINTVTKKVVAINRTYDDAVLVASAFNHFYCKPNLKDTYFPKRKKDNHAKDL